MAEETKTKGRPKPLRRYSNDLVFQPDGNEGEQFYPHYGEYIEFTPHMTVGQSIFSESQLSERSNKDVLAWLGDRLTAWSWTDHRGNPYGPPTERELQRLSMVELIWILQTVNGLRGQETNEDPLAGESVTSDGSEAMADVLTTDGS